MNCGKIALYLSLAACGGMAFVVYKALKITKDVDVTIGNIAEKIPVEIEKDILEKATKEAVTMEVSRRVAFASQQVYSDAKSEIKEAVNKEVSKQKDDMALEVKKEIEKKVAKIDIDDLRKEVISEAKEKVSDKFDSDLQSILDKYNSDLSNISKIYSSIANSIGGGGGIKISAN